MMSMRPRCAEQQRPGSVRTRDTKGGVTRTRNARMRSGHRSLWEAIEEAGLPSGQAHDLAHRTIEDRLKYVFVESAMDTPAFFSVAPRGGAIMVRINTEHPVYTHLIEVLEQQEDESTGNAEGRLANAREGLRLLLEAWGSIMKTSSPKVHAAMLPWTHAATGGVLPAAFSRPSYERK